MELSGGRPQKWLGERQGIADWILASDDPALHWQDFSRGIGRIMRRSGADRHGRWESKCRLRRPENELAGASLSADEEVAPERGIVGLSDHCNKLGAGFLTPSSPEKENTQEGGGLSSSRVNRREKWVTGKQTPPEIMDAGWIVMCRSMPRSRKVQF
ncbi:hypothetical protein L1887_39078 [Cichorium endivia]|nr:hypothetical protein L1887_39072 [Cichorium endivia]KAI3496705.1 hypothetical protein L1887_39078 [Cichorium endivia]